MAEQPKEIPLAELLDRIDAARQRMSPKNEHRHLFGVCRSALIQLAQRVAAGEPTKAPHAQDAPDAV